MKCLLVCLLLISAPTALFADTRTRDVQQQLSDLGFYYGRVDGVLGPETEAAIRRYQIRNGLSVTGTLTEETLEKLRGRGGGMPPTVQQTQPRRAPPSSVIESDRAFLDSDPDSRAEKRQPVRREDKQGLDDDRWRSQPPEPEVSRLDLLFVGTPWARADSEDQREMLVRAQIQLRRYRYYFGEIDGIPGQMTTRAIEEFQWDEDLRLTGRLDGPTLRALGLRYGDSYRKRRFYEEPARRYYRGYWVR